MMPHVGPMIRQYNVFYSATLKKLIQVYTWWFKPARQYRRKKKIFYNIIILLDTEEEEEEDILLFTNYGPTMGMDIHIYNHLKHNMFNKDKDTITYIYNMSFICSVWLICFDTSSYDICII